jgi:transposase-like protein
MREECSMSKKRSGRRARRSFSPEFKADVVRLCRSGEEKIGDVAKRLDLTETAVRAWVKQAEVDAGGGATETLTTTEREELARLRRENKRLTMERDILKKATAFFAKEGS